MFLSFAQALGGSPLSIWIQSHLWVTPLLQSIHIVMIGVVFVAILMITLRVLGKVGTDETFAGEAFDHIPEFALFTTDNRSEKHDTSAGRQREDFIDDIAGSLVSDWFAADRAVRLADVGVEKAEVIVNLGGGSNDGTRIGAGTALFDRDSG